MMSLSAIPLIFTNWEFRGRRAGSLLSAATVSFQRG